MYVGENYIPKGNESFIRFVVYGPAGKLAQRCPLSMDEKLPKGVMILHSYRCSNLTHLLLSTYLFCYIVVSFIVISFVVIRVIVIIHSLSIIPSLCLLICCCGFYHNYLIITISIPTLAFYHSTSSYHIISTILSSHLQIIHSSIPLSITTPCINSDGSTRS